jgi:ketosteroid isomerase-like protein
MRCAGLRTLLITVAVLAVLPLLVPAVVHAQDTDAMLTRYIAALNTNMPPRLNAAAVANLFAEDGVQWHPFGEPRFAGGQPQRGREALTRFFAAFDSWKDWTHVERSRTVQGSHALWEGTAQGTHKDTGKFVKLPIVFVLEFTPEGLVKEDRVYVDQHLVGEQLK